MTELLAALIGALVGAIAAAYIVSWFASRHFDRALEKFCAGSLAERARERRQREKIEKEAGR